MNENKTVKTLEHYESSIVMLGEAFESATDVEEKKRIAGEIMNVTKEMLEYEQALKNAIIKALDELI